MTALPPASEGTVYRLERLNGDQYTTTGTFLPSAPRRTTTHLVSAPALILDCDLADFELPKGTKDEIDARKAVLRALPQAELDTRLEPLAPRIAEVVTLLCGAPPTRIVTSGYGVHVYLWLSAADALRVPEVRAANRALMLRVNEVAGFKLADPAVHDAGTRILRVVGTVNTKTPAMPRPVVELHRADTVHDLERWLTVAPAKAVAPAPAPAPAKAAKAKAKAVAPAPAETADPFAAFFARPAAALEWMLAECPFFRWAQENPEKVGRESWRGCATNIAFLMGEEGRATFRVFSQLDPSRYDAPACDRFFDDALKSADAHGAMKYTTLAACGEWPGPAPDGEASPALRARATVRPPPPVPAPAPAPTKAAKAAKAKASTPGRVFEDDKRELWRNAKTGAVIPNVTNLRILLREDPEGASVRFNGFSATCELNGRPFEDDRAGVVVEYFQRAENVSFPLAWIGQSVRNIASEREYNPMQDFVKSRAWDVAAREGNILIDVLGAEDTPLNRAYLRCFLVGAVARLFSTNVEGVKMDTVLILKGPQGAEKSRFFNTLAGEYYFESTIDVESKEGYIAIARAWIIEWFEIDNALSRAQQSAIKGFLSAKVDTYRPPYARHSITVPRRGVIVGTTNEDQFLRDPTGSRRFHVIETARKVNTELLASMRDQIWAEAYHHYRNGVQWWLTDEEEALRETANEAFQVEETWEATVEKYVVKFPEVTFERIMVEAVQKECANWTDRDRRKVGFIMKKLGWTCERARHDGVMTRVYFRPPSELGAEDAAADNLVPFTPPPAPSHKLPKPPKVGE